MSKNLKAVKNGISNVDDEQMERLRAAVVREELQARYVKAIFEQKDYALKAEDLREPYNELLLKEKSRYEENIKKEIEAARAKYDASQTKEEVQAASGEEF